ncbi:unnamed protein product [Orchesella dallaii]|uniref:Frizzled-8 n=1 Tax=Orchesella dallaii TaxID=48710 RepID=A0ABP1PKI3_9HEXA
MGVIKLYSLLLTLSNFYLSHANHEPAPIVTLSVAESPVDNSLLETSSRCQEITIPMCKSIRYNYTTMPNPFNHETQDEAGLEVHQYWPLVEIKCSDDLKFFICSLYVPICMEDYVGTVPPCRSVCERARAGCEPVMTQYGFTWPERMICDKFPKFGKHSICMDEKGGELPGSQTRIHKLPDRAGVFSSGIGSTPSKKCDRESCECRHPLVLLNSNSYVQPQNYKQNSSNNIITGSVSHCAFPCRGYGYGSPEEIRFANYWLTFWSSVTCGLSTITILTFIIDSTRFNYPERPIICISFCYIFVSIGYLTRIYVGHAETACGGENSPVIRYPNVLIQPFQTFNPVCTIVFLLIYYFTISSSIWYVILTITWYLASVLKWSTEAISEKSGAFHTTVWVSSAIITLTILLSGSIDGDSISGICFVGNQEYWNLVSYVLVPMSSLLLIGTFFLISGFIALLRIRSVIVREVGNVHKLEKLMIRIGVFSVLYTLNVVAVLAAYVYEAYVREEWVTTLNCNQCNDVVVENGNFKPAYSVLMIKYFMSLAIGITSSIWVFSSKTIETWKRFVYSKFLCICFPNACSSSSSSATSQHTSILTSNHKQTHV